MDETIYGPDEINAMRAALDKSWSALAFAHWEDERDMRQTRETLARTILRVAASGERGVTALSDRALGALEPRRAGSQRWHVSRFVS